MRLHHLLRNAECVDDQAVTSGFIYDLGSYPGAQFKAGAKIVGELYEVTPKILEELDRVEGFLHDNKRHSLFWRKKIQVMICTPGSGLGSVVEAFAYEWNRGTAGLIPIASGNYKSYMRASHETNHF